MQEACAPSDTSITTYIAQKIIRYLLLFLFLSLIDNTFSTVTHAQSCISELEPNNGLEVSSLQMNHLDTCIRHYTDLI